MINKIIFKFIFFLILSFIIFITALSTIGFETKRFNKLIVKRIAETKNINLSLEKISFKLDPRKLSLFLETKKPNIVYNGISIPTQNIKVYIDFLPLLQTKLKIKKINIILNELNIREIHELSSFIKPSNFKSFLNNNIKKGKLISEIELFFNKEGLFENYIAKGSIKNFEAEFFKDINITKTNFDFFADKNDILIKNILGEISEIKISDGDIKINLENGLILNSNFNSKFKIDKSFLNNYKKYFKNYDLVNNLNEIQGNIKNSFFINFDKTYKLKEYNYSLTGNIDKSKFIFIKPFKSKFFEEEIKEFYISNFKIKSIFSKENKQFTGSGEYSFNNQNFNKINLEQSLKKNLLKFNLNFDYRNSFNLEIINYKKKKNSIANVALNLEKNNRKTLINKLVIKEGKNSIKLKDLKFNKTNFLSFKNIEIFTENNNFSVKNDKKILIEGSKFDATNLIKLLSKKENNNDFKNISSDIEIDFKDVKIPLSERLQNFKLIGKIEKGKFIKISSKGDFGNNNFLDVSMKKDYKTNKKYLEIYSDLTRPLLTEYSFFKGLTGGKLLFTSLIDGEKSNSKLKIENFKVVNAPNVIKLLSLADLGGLLDLAEGDGLSFDLLEIDMEKNNTILKLNEILALGPSMSVLIEGYQDNTGLTSLKGTLVPAKTLNKMISKIPVIGNIVIPKEAGEGLFGISFKMKGPKGNIKTTINPIRTLTPRFIQKIIDKNKVSK